MSRCFRSPIHLLGGTTARSTCKERIQPFPNRFDCRRTCSVRTYEKRQVVQACQILRNIMQTSSPSTVTPTTNLCPASVAAQDVPKFVAPVPKLVDYLSASERGSASVSVDQFKSLYSMAKEHATLDKVNSKHMTYIISLFGALSMPPPRPTCIYIPKLVPHSNNRNEEAHWKFILEVARDKEKLGYVLNGTDRFWIMRAELARLPAWPGQLIHRSIARAKMQYIRIWRRTPDPEVHVPFLKALMSFSPLHLSDVVKYICQLLVLYDTPHCRILNIFWTIVRQHDDSLSSDQKENLLSVCSTRLKASASRRTTGGVQDMKNTMNLGDALANHLFPRHAAPAPEATLQQWMQEVSLSTFNSAIPLKMRWSNLSLLAVYINPHGSYRPHSPQNADLTPEMVEWRTALMLATLEKAVSDITLGSMMQGFAKVIHSVWSTWKDSEYDRPLLVSQAIITSFLRLSVIARDEKLLKVCAQYASSKKLWPTSKDEDNTGAMDLLASYLTGLVHCQGARWPRIFQILDENLLTRAQCAYAIHLLLQHFIVHDVTVAHELYQLCQKRGICVSAIDVHRLAHGLTVSHQLHEAVTFLYTPTFSPCHVERLLGAILDTFRTIRPEVIDSRLAAEIGGIMEKLYTRRKPPMLLKYPIRFFLSIMITSGHSTKAVNIIKTLAQSSPSFFTARLFTRLVRVLLRKREFKYAVHVLRIAQKTTPSRSIDIIRNETVTWLANAGATNLARRLSPALGFLPTRLSMLRTTLFRVQRPSAVVTLRILRMLSRMPSNEQTIKDVITLLVHARRLYAAKRLAQTKCSDLTGESTTVIGNTILHGLLLHRRQRNGRLAASLLRTKTQLEKTCRFLPDRVTMNIIVKAILQWHTVVDASQVRNLFDRVVRLGYPSGFQKNSRYGVPFGTPPTTSQRLELPVLASPLSLRKHTRPLYKMFIKAFYMRGDAIAAKAVISILKDETENVMREREKRERARQRGIQRKKARSA
ncbi:hypothetical protein APHAL10511_007451 [Amanita phalloides]|nr:hypothetical protein APHAL10511_007451 [Amanita phalloides]